jgi:uncharacterized membrane protein
LQKKKPLLISIIFLLLITIFFPIEKAHSEYTPQELQFHLYQDGVADIDYEIDVDPTRARINVTLFGTIYRNLIVIDQDGLPLEYDIKDGYITLDVLGSYEAEITYSTPELTNKNGTIWSLSLNPPMDVIIQLPEEATIVGLEPTPKTITMTATGISLTMPQGPLTVTYTLGATGTRDLALTKINEAEETIQGIRDQGINVTEAEKLLESAQEEYEGENYLLAEGYAEQAQEKAQEIQIMAEEAHSKIQEADDAIISAEESGRTTNLQEARSKMDEAETAYDTGDYTGATSKAAEAENLANTSKTPNKSSNLYLLLGAGLAIIGALAFLRTRMERPDEDKIEDKIRLQDIFEGHPQLREDEKEVIQYITETPEGVFASDLRERFNLARSTAWRMINRLEETGILETSLVGRETHVKISETFRGRDS